jgi:hypothetical protein
MSYYHSYHSVLLSIIRIIQCYYLSVIGMICHSLLLSIIKLIIHRYYLSFIIHCYCLLSSLSSIVMSIIHCYHLSFILISHRYYLSYHSGDLDRAAADKLGFGPGGVPEELLGDYSEEEVPKIPAAAISVEDAAMLRRMTARSPAVVVRLEMEAREEGTATRHSLFSVHFYFYFYFYFFYFYSYFCIQRWRRARRAMSPGPHSVLFISISISVLLLFYFYFYFYFIFILYLFFTFQPVIFFSYPDIFCCKFRNFC